MTRAVVTLALCLSACTAPHAPWTLAGDHLDAQQVADVDGIVAASLRVMPDRRDYIAHGGEIQISRNVSIDASCGIEYASGCCADRGRKIWLLICTPQTSECPVSDIIEYTALAHELAHLGLAVPPHWYGGGASDATEREADAGAREIIAEWKRGRLP
jgi:hypothetical protein